jgi:hypothetical protein
MQLQDMRVLDLSPAKLRRGDFVYLRGLLFRVQHLYKFRGRVQVITDEGVPIELHRADKVTTLRAVG